jgi:hypothetical protein
VDARVETEKRGWHDQVGEPVVNDKDLDSAARRFIQGLLELPPGSSSFQMNVSIKIRSFASPIAWIMSP